MAGGTVASGISIYSSTFTAAGTAEATTFADRYGYVVVTNTSTTGEIYATTNGSAASATNGLPVGPGQSVVIANGLALWFPSSTVLRAGKLIYPDGSGTPQTNTTKNGQPGEVQPFQSSLQGQVANPGTNVSLWTAASGGATSYTISGTG